MPNASGSLVGIVGVLLLAGGFAAGYLVGAGGDGDAPADADVLDHAARPDVAPTRPGVRVEEVAEDVRLASARTTELEPLRKVLDALPPPPVTRGTGVITGVVKTKDGTPLAGVKVTGVPKTPTSLRGPKWKDGVEPDLPSSVRGYVNGMRWRKLARSEAVTGADGRYRLTDLVDGAHHLDARLEGWRIRRLGRGDGWVEPGATEDFEAKRITQVLVQVYLPDGTRPETARLSFKESRRSEERGWRSDQPAVSVNPGTYRVTATAGDAQEYESAPVQVTVEKDGGTPEIRLDLAGRPIIRGRLLFPVGQGTDRASVRIARIPKGQPAEAALLTSEVQSDSARMRRGEHPAFGFEDLKPGRYVLGVARSRRGVIVAIKEVELGNGLLEVDLEVPPLKREEYVIVTVTGPDGKPLSDIGVTTGFRFDSGSSTGGSVVIERPDGVRWVMHHGHNYGNAEDGTYWIQLRHTRYGMREVEYAAGKAPAFDVRFEEPASLSVTVTDLVGTPYDGRVGVTLKQGSHVQRRFRGGPAQELDDTGHVRIEGVQPGDYELVLTLGGIRFGDSEIARKQVTVSTGANRARMPMPALFEVRFEGIEGRAFIRSDKAGVDHRIVTGTADGRGVIDGLPAGTYTLHCGHNQVEFRLPGATTVRVE